MSHRQFTLAAPTGWRARIGLALSMALGLGLAAAFVLLSIGIAIVLLPAVGVALGIGWWRWRKMTAALREQAARERRRPEAGRIIEAEYRVLDDGARSG